MAPQMAAALLLAPIMTPRTQPPAAPYGRVVRAP